MSPKTALAAGLKVDAGALPTSLKQQIKDGKVDLDDPATTLALLRLNAVVGVAGLFDDKGRLTSMGLQCALCHSTVDDSFAPGIGQRLDGWANRRCSGRCAGGVSFSRRSEPRMTVASLPAATGRSVCGTPAAHVVRLSRSRKLVRSPTP